MRPPHQQPVFDRHDFMKRVHVPMVREQHFSHSLEKQGLFFELGRRGDFNKRLSIVDGIHFEQRLDQNRFMTGRVPWVFEKGFDERVVNIHDLKFVTVESAKFFRSMIP